MFGGMHLEKEVQGPGDDSRLTLRTLHPSHSRSATDGVLAPGELQKVYSRPARKAWLNGSIAERRPRIPLQDSVLPTAAFALIWYLKHSSTANYVALGVPSYCDMLHCNPAVRNL